MRSLSRVLGLRTEGSRAGDRRLAARRLSPFGCELLEGRALLSGIPGVSLSDTRLAITATKASGNVAEVSIDPANHDIKVSLNGQSEEFSPSSVSGVTYHGGKNGGDTFVNDTKLLEIADGYGGHNNFTGGTSVYNVITFHGNDNTYNARAGSTNDVYEAGAADTIHKATGANVTVVTYPSWMWPYIQ